MAQKPSLPKGTRDFSPEEVAKRNYILGIIKSNFEKFGFRPIETPSFENSETLLGKYGEEGDRLIFKILDSGDFMEKIRDKFLGTNKLSRNILSNLNNLYGKIKSNPDLKNYKFIGYFENKFLERYFEEKKEYLYKKLKDIYKETNNNPSLEIRRINLLSEEILDKNFYNYFNDDEPGLIESLKNIIEGPKLAKHISSKALRYDLTVPFARYVVQHQNELDFPFKRYQIQPVWRADRPQKGRFREFFQCDADAVGSRGLWQEVDFVLLYDAVFSDLGIERTRIKLNHRKILSGFAEVIGETEKLIDFTVALDKLDKIGEAGVKKEMLEKGIRPEALHEIQPIFEISGNFEEKIAVLKHILKNSEIGKEGIEELEFVHEIIKSVPLKTAILELDVTLARGLNYYTGAIFEVAAPDEVKLGSIGGGGRYDDLTGIFGLKDLSGVGISFGLDRIYLVLEELDLFPTNLGESIKVLFLNYGEKEALYCLKAINQLRNLGISAELFPDASKMKKQMNYANKRKVPYVVLAGNKELEKEVFTLKNMITGEQTEVSFEELIKIITVNDEGFQNLSVTVLE